MEQQKFFCVFVCLLCKKMRARDAQKISFLHTKVSRIRLTYTQCTKEQNKIFTFDTFHLISKLKNSFRNTQLFNLYFIVLQTKSFLCGTVWHEMLFPPTRLCLVSIHRTSRLSTYMINITTDLIRLVYTLVLTYRHTLHTKM